MKGNNLLTKAMIEALLYRVEQIRGHPYCQPELAAILARLTEEMPRVLEEHLAPERLRLLIQSLEFTSSWDPTGTDWTITMHAIAQIRKLVPELDGTC